MINRLLKSKENLKGKFVRRCMMDSKSEGMDFTCKDCGGKVLFVYITYSVITSYKTAYFDSLELLEVTSITEYEEDGWLDEDHQIIYFPSQPTYCGNYLDDRVLHSLDESELHNYTDGEEVEGESKRDEDSVVYKVQCKGCKRDIEFGWSEDGLIWPSEAKDFDPEICEPDPRYKESWIKKAGHKIV